MCCSCAGGSLSCNHTVWGVDMEMGWFLQCPKIQTRHWWAGNVKCVSETLQARGKRRASGKEPNRQVISHRGKNLAQSIIYTIYNSLHKFNQIAVLSQAHICIWWLGSLDLTPLVSKHLAWSLFCSLKWSSKLAIWLSIWTWLLKS